MTEQLDQSADATGASDQPSGSAQTPDLEALVSNAVQKALGGLDDRFSGFQSMIDKKFAPIAQTVDQLKTALSPEEQEQLNADAERAELEAARRRIQILEARKDHPKEVDIFVEVMDADSFEGQLAVIRKHFGGAAADQVEQAVEAAAEQSTVPEVDRNNPARPKQGGASLAGYGDMTDEIADAILKQGGKGALVGRRG